jgi:hypothetical protein
MPETFVVDVYRLVGLLEGRWQSEGIKTLCHTLETQIRAKIDARERREVYGAYRSAVPGSEEREAHRREYHDMKGTPKDWRTQKETTL